MHFFSLKKANRDIEELKDLYDEDGESFNNDEISIPFCIIPLNSDLSKYNIDCILNYYPQLGPLFWYHSVFNSVSIDNKKKVFKYYRDFFSYDVLTQMLQEGFYKEAIKILKKVDEGCQHFSSYIGEPFIIRDGEREELKKEQYYGILFNDDKIRTVVDRFDHMKKFSNYFLDLANVLSQRGLDITPFFIFIPQDLNFDRIKNLLIAGKLNINQKCSK
jgi:hypothetical protein